MTLQEVNDLSTYLNAVTVNMSDRVIGSLICAMIDNWCQFNDEDVTDFLEDIRLNLLLHKED